MSFPMDTLLLRNLKILMLVVVVVVIDSSMMEANGNSQLLYNNPVFTLAPGLYSVSYRSV